MTKSNELNKTRKINEKDTFNEQDVKLKNKVYRKWERNYTNLANTCIN